MRLSRSFSTKAGLAWGFVLLSSLVAAAQANEVPPRVTEAVDVRSLVTLRGNTHPLARPEYDRGAAPESLPMRRMLLVLQRSPEQEAALRKLLDEQQTESSPNYHQWLTPEEFGRQFGPADADIQAVTDWLTTEGFEVNHVAAGRTVIEFSGTAALVRQALHAEIHKYAVNGKEYWANANDPQIPAALRPVIAGIASLNNFPREPESTLPGTLSQPNLTGQISPDLTFTTSAGAFVVGPGDFATIYNLLPLWNAGVDGSGQSIGIVGLSNINIQDVRDFRSLFGLPANDPQIILNGPDPGIVQGEEGEADLDVEWSGAVAKGATIKFVVSESTNPTVGLELSFLYIVDNNLAPVMSESFSACELQLGAGGNSVQYFLREQAAAQGITVIDSSGDEGSARCDGPPETAATQGLAVSGLASTPFNVAVGGTDFQQGTDTSTYWNLTTNSPPYQTSALSYIPETTWNYSCARTGSLTGCPTVPTSGKDIQAAGGGRSTSAIFITNSNGTVSILPYPKPSWQTGPGVPNDFARDIPDVSLLAAGRYVVCQMDANAGTGSSTSPCDLNHFQVWQGTSAAAPAFAGIMALVNQKTNQRQGNANYVLYPLAARSGASCASNASAVTSSSCIFYDVVTGNNSVACVGGSPNCSNTGSGFGVLVDPSNPTVPAWTTTSGYDLATGLGSVNAANLVNNWTSVTFAPTTTHLMLSPTAITYGQPVNVSVTVTSTSGTPTGDFSLIGGPNNIGLGFATLASGTFSGAANFLPGGTYGVTAHYAGDGTFAASDSAPPRQVTISPAATSTSVTANPSTVAAGASVTLTAVVSTQSHGVAPSGTVTFMNAGSPITGAITYTATNGSASGPASLQATLTASFTATANITAQYSGDTNYGTSLTAAPTTVTVSGSSVSASPTSLTFASQRVGTTSAAQTVTLSNTGSASLTISSVGVTGDFAQTNNCGTSVAAGANCAISVTFTPTAAGTRTGTLSITDNASGSPQTVALSGTGTGTVVGLSPTSLTFSGQTVGATSAAQTVTLSNTGSAPLTISSVGVTGDFAQTNNCGTSVAGGANCAISVTFTPTAAGTRTGTLSITDNAGNSPQTVALSGAGEDFSIAVATGTPSTATVAAGSSASYSLSVMPAGGFNQAVSLSCAGAPSLATCSLSPASVALDGTNAASVKVTVTTTASTMTPPLPLDPRGHTGFPLPTLWVIAMAALAATTFRRRRFRAALASAVICVALWASCGGGGGGGGGGGAIHTAGTPTGNYTLTVTGASGNLTHSTTVTLTVQ